MSSTVLHTMHFLPVATSSCQLATWRVLKTVTHPIMKCQVLTDSSCESAVTHCEVESPQCISSRSTYVAKPAGELCKTAARNIGDQTRNCAPPPPLPHNADRELPPSPQTTLSTGKCHPNNSADTPPPPPPTPPNHIADMHPPPIYQCRQVPSLIPRQCSAGCCSVNASSQTRVCNGVPAYHKGRLSQDAGSRNRRSQS